MRNCHGGVIAIGVEDIPIGEYGLDDVMQPQYSPLLINAFDAMSQLTASKLSPPFDPRPRSGVEHSPLHGRQSFHQPRMASPAAKSRQSGVSCRIPPVCPVSYAGAHPFVVGLHDGVPEIEVRFVTTDIPADEVHDKQSGRSPNLWRRGTTPALRCPVWVSTSLSLRLFPTARVDYTKTWDSSVGG